MMNIDTGDFPVTFCPSGIAAGIAIISPIKQKSRNGRHLATAFVTSGLPDPLKRLARAKIAQALSDLNCFTGAGWRYNRTIAVQFLSSYELVIWCDIAGLSASKVHRRALELGLKTNIK